MIAAHQLLAGHFGFVLLKALENRFCQALELALFSGHF